MRVARKREPRVVKEKSHKEEERLTPEHIITKEMCEFALEQMHEYDTQERMKQIEPLLEMPQNRRTADNMTNAKNFEYSYVKLKLLYDEWLRLYESDLYHINRKKEGFVQQPQRKPRTIQDVIKIFEQKPKDLEKNAFYSNMYEEFVEVLLYWEEWVQSVKKTHVKDFFDKFYETIHQMIDDMELPFQQEK